MFKHWLLRGGIAAALALPFSAEAATLAAFDSEPGELIFDGQDRTLAASEFTYENLGFVVSEGVIEFRIVSTSPAGGAYTLEFHTQAGAALIGPTHVAVENPMGAANARILIRWNNRPCLLPGDGAFRVHEAEGATNQTPTKLALDFQFRCAGSTGVLRGAIRLNSDVPVAQAQPVAVAHGPRLVDEGDSVTLDGRKSWAGPAPITAYSWTQLSGPVVMLDDAASATPQFVAVADSGQLSPLVFELTITDAIGNQATAQATVSAFDPAAPQTYLALQGEVGEYVLNGRDYLFREPDVQLSAAYYYSNDAIQVMPTHEQYRVVFRGPAGVPLTADNYENATRLASPAGAGLTLFGDGRGCNGELGRFTIHEIESHPVTGELTKLAMDFERRCTSNPDSPQKAFGQIRINSTVPRTRTAPLAAAGIDQLASEQAPVALDARNSRAGADLIASWQWTQVSGPEVVIDDAAMAQASFTAPAVATGSVELEFDLTVTDTQGRSDLDRVKVTVLSAAAPRNLLYIDGSRGDYIGQGIVATFDDTHGLFESFAYQPGVLTLGFNGGTVAFGVTIAAPSGQELAVDNYERTERNATLFSPKRPTLEVGSLGRGCNDPRGRFVVREIILAPDGTAERLAVDFEQYCDGQDVPLTGALRYQSSVPIDIPEPTAAAGPDRRLLERDNVTLDGRNTMPGAGSVTTWQWQQVAGPAVQLVDANTSVARFVAPSVPGTSETLRFALQVTNSAGHQDTDEVEIVVRDKLAPRNLVTMLADNFVSLGQDTILTEEDGVLEAFDLGQGRSALQMGWTGVGDDWFFTLILDADMAVGHYVDVTQSDAPNLRVSAGSRGCNVTLGTFDILEVAFSGDVVSSLALDFEQFCDHFTVPLRGKLRYNVQMPEANAGADVAAVGNGTALLNGSGSAAGSVLSYQWVQLTGPAVGLSGANTPGPEFTAPDVMVVTTLTFRLTVTDDRGDDDRDVVTVTVSPAPADDNGGGGGGGGGIGVLTLAALLFARAARGIRQSG